MATPDIYTRQPIPLVADSRPRVDYVLPDGEVVRIICDHGEEPKPTITFEKYGEVVIADRADLVESNQVARIIAALDAVFAARELVRPHIGRGIMDCAYGSELITLWAHELPKAEYALQLWASSKGLTLTEHTSKYDHNGTQIRVVECPGIARIQYPAEPQPLPQPVPGVVIPLPVEPPAPPVAASEPEPTPSSPEPDDTAARMSQLELD